MKNNKDTNPRKSGNSSSRIKHVVVVVVVLTGYLLLEERNYWSSALGPIPKATDTVIHHTETEAEKKNTKKTR